MPNGGVYGMGGAVNHLETSGHSFYTFWMCLFISTHLVIKSAGRQQVEDKSAELQSKNISGTCWSFCTMHVAIASQNVSLTFMYPWVWVKEISLVIYHTNAHTDTHTLKYNLCPRSLPSGVLYIHPWLHSRPDSCCSGVFVH